ncbi:P-type conjugative transfer protein TrbG [Novosphingobium sp. 9]|uniref:P-type conjugative transfer protein TrbG n=1 Tax=Novosphingobium sp. 9 TaxID=2025349 RepID=UPI0021B5F0B1|nr:P-type conjugative transfer protein TrbG [Novosphingobium sp. 9]
MSFAAGLGVPTALPGARIAVRSQPTVPVRPADGKHIVAVHATAHHGARHRLRRRPAPTARARARNGAAARVRQANAAARIGPDAESDASGIVQYAWSESALYQVYTAPGRVTDIVLEAGEKFAGSGPVAAGDTARWIIGDTASGAGASAHLHVLVKPARAGIATNLVINTDRRTYHIELHATPSTYMASVSWTYPADALIALQAGAGMVPSPSPSPSGPAIDAAALDFGYRLKGDRPRWRPLRVFGDGHRVLIQFPDDIGTGEMPPLFVMGEHGASELVNYRVEGRYMIVDRLFDQAQLRLGTAKTQQSVIIEHVARARRSEAGT